MARTTITAADLLGSYPATPLTADSADYAYAASDLANGNQVAMDGKLLVLVQNTDAGAQTITFTSVVDSKNRLGTITAYSVGIGEFAAFGPFDPDGWKQTDGMFYINTSDVDVKLKVFKIPR